MATKFREAAENRTTNKLEIIRLIQTPPGAFMRKFEMRLCVSLESEPITDTMDRLDINWRLCTRFDFFTYAPDVHVHAAGRHRSIVTPNAIQKLVAAENHSR